MSSNVRDKTRPTNVESSFVDPNVEEFFEDKWDPLAYLNEGYDQRYDLDLDEIEELGRGARSVLGEYGIEYTSPLPGRTVQGEEVGDDRVDLTLDAARGATVLHVQEALMKMVTSKEDTNLSTSIWNFCEVSGGLPTTKSSSFDRCRRTGEFQNLGFTDVPPLRILLDVSKGDRSHSSTVPGKASMIANRMRTPRSNLLPYWNLASYLQDGLLRTSRSTEPKYLPQIMGGSGCRALYQNPDNLFLSVQAYRGGEYQRIYGTACAELRTCLDYLERDQATMPVLCSRLRDKQEYLHGTYAEKVFIPTRTLMDAKKDRLPVALVEASGGSNLFSAFENRLVRTRHLVTRSVAEQEWLFTERIRVQLLDRVNTVVATDAFAKDLRSQARARFDMALSANAAFANLLRRDATVKDVQALTNSDFLVVNTGVTAFTKWDAEWLFFGGKTERFSIEDLASTEDLFLRTDVSSEETFKVGGIPLNPIVGRVTRPTVTTTKVGLYQINSSMTEWADRIVGQLTQARDEKQAPLLPYEAQTVYMTDTEWVNDDTALIGRCLRDTRSLSERSGRVILVSADKRLANQMANTCNVHVYLLHPRDYILWCRGLRLDFQKEPPLRLLSSRIGMGGRKDPFRQVYLDTGSIAAHAVDLQADANPLSAQTYRRSGETPSLSEDGRRVNSYTLHKLENPEFLRVSVYRPVITQKRARYPEGYQSLSSSDRQGAHMRLHSWRSESASSEYMTAKTGQN